MLARGFYRHYKGGIYRVLGMARHHETGEPVVIYFSMERGSINVRELTNWQAEPEPGVQRFAFIQNGQQADLLEPLLTK